MSLEIRPTPTLTGKSAERVSEIIAKNDQSYVPMSPEKEREIRNELDRMFKKAKI